MSPAAIRPGRTQRVTHVAAMHHLVQGQRQKLRPKVANSVASIAFAPEAFKTSDEQMHALRIVLNATIPHFIGTSDAMSPAEAVFLTGFLTQQKLYNPGLRLDPQEVAAWRASRPAEQSFVDTYRTSHSAVLIARAMPREMVDVESALREQMPHEWSLVTICVHLFLDRAGLPR